MTFIFPSKGAWWSPVSSGIWAIRLQHHKFARNWKFEERLPTRMTFNN